MKFRKNMVIKSYIKLQKNSVKISLPLISRTFDKLYISYKNEKISLNFDKKLFLKNHIFWVSKLSYGYLIYFLDIEKFEEIELFVQDYKIVDFEYMWKNYSIIVYFYKNEIKFLSYYFPDELSLSYENDYFYIKNVILWTEIFSKKIKFIKDKVFSNKKKDWKLDIFTFYDFDSLFLKTKRINNIYNSYDDFTVKIDSFRSDFYYVDKIDISKNLDFSQMDIYYKNGYKLDKNNVFIKDLMKIIAFKNKYTLKIEALNEFQNIVPKYNLVQDFKIESFENVDLVSINFENIDKSLVDFQKNILNLQFLLFNLDYNKQKIQDIMKENIPRIDFEKRLEIMEKNIKQVRIKLKEIFWKYIEQILITKK